MVVNSDGIMRMQFTRPIISEDSNVNNYIVVTMYIQLRTYITGYIKLMRF